MSIRLNKKETAVLEAMTKVIMSMDPRADMIMEALYHSDEAKELILTTNLWRTFSGIEEKIARVK